MPGSTSRTARRPPRLPGSTPAPLGPGGSGCPAPPIPPGPALPPRLPGSPASNVDALAGASSRLPGRRPLRRPPARPPRLPGSVSPAPHRLPREGSSARIRIILHRPRFRLVAPVGPSVPLVTLAGSLVLRHRSSGPGWRALAGTGHTLPGVFPQVKRVFLSSQGYPRTFRESHRTFSFVHRSRTACPQSRCREPVRHV